MTTEKSLDAILKAKLDGMTDEAIMKCFSVSLRDIEKAVIRKTGTNLNLFSSKSTLTGLAPKDFVLQSTTMWSFKSRGNWATHNGNYRGNWSPYVPRNVILRYSSPSDLVLDQFCGAGTTAVEAKLLGRRCVARDINPAAISLARQNLDFPVPMQGTLDDSGETARFYEPIVETGDARFLKGIDDGSVDLVCTHPPYADIVHYTDGNPDDISFHGVEEFIKDMSVVARECFRVLKPGGICAILIGDTRKNKYVVPIGFRTIEAFIDEGFHLKDLVIKRQHNCRTAGFWYSSSIRNNFLLLAHEYLPVFVKSSQEQKTVSRPVTGEQAFKFQQADLPPLPDTMECRTTWVFPAARFDELVDANVMNRYGNQTSVLQVESFCGKQIPSTCDDRQYGLVYLKVSCGSSNISNDGGKLTKLAETIVDGVLPLIKPGGHLVVRAKDVRKGGTLTSPALQLWRAPNEDFRLREIVTLSYEASQDRMTASPCLEITHEFLLVYKRNT